MNTRAIDFVTEDFYESLCFMDGELPDLETVTDLFYDKGQLVNMNFGKPVFYTAETFSTYLAGEVGEGRLTQFMQRELYSKTEIFGRIARRVSVYEYSLSYYETENLPRGINYIQFIQIDDDWRITSMVWCDESATNHIPAGLLS